VGAEFAKGWKDDEFAGAGDDRLVFELPGMFVRDVDGVQADLHGGIDVAARAVPIIQPWAFTILCLRTSSP